MLETVEKRRQAIPDKLLSLLVEYVPSVLLRSVFANFLYNALGIRVRVPLRVRLSGPLSPHLLPVPVSNVRVGIIPNPRLTMCQLSGSSLIEFGNPDYELL
ncbi:hypothetical protein BVRB_1g021500 [Beta vulgaris subsp. vulgaris]|nr:hypothetical protein BVRB_1g021500 [Beta vulgaris subsp. vulgaris]